MENNKINFKFKLQWYFNNKKTIKTIFKVVYILLIILLLAFIFNSNTAKGEATRINIDDIKDLTKKIGDLSNKINTSQPLTSSKGGYPWYSRWFFNILWEINKLLIGVIDGFIAGVKYFYTAEALKFFFKKLKIDISGIENIIFILFVSLGFVSILALCVYNAFKNFFLLYKKKQNELFNLIKSLMFFIIMVFLLPAFIISLLFLIGKINTLFFSNLEEMNMGRSIYKLGWNGNYFNKDIIHRLNNGEQWIDIGPKFYYSSNYDVIMNIVFCIFLIYVFFFLIQKILTRILFLFSLLLLIPIFAIAYSKTNEKCNSFIKTLLINIIMYFVDAIILSIFLNIMFAVLTKSDYIPISSKPPLNHFLINKISNMFFQVLILLTLRKLFEKLIDKTESLLFQETTGNYNTSIYQDSKTMAKKGAKYGQSKYQKSRLKRSIQSGKAKLKRGKTTLKNKIKTSFKNRYKKK